MREGVYTLPVLYALADGSNGRELGPSCARGRRRAIAWRRPGADPERRGPF